jgi:hypothetical protein
MKGATMFQESEIVTLIMGIIGICILFTSVKRFRFPGAEYFKGGFTVLFLSYVFTVVEGVLWQDLFNLFEHFGYLFSGCLFAVGCARLSKSSKTGAIDKERSK